jgi:anti-sigma B factor antagonist
MMVDRGGKMQSSGDLVLDVSWRGLASVVRLVGSVGMAEAPMLSLELEELVQQYGAVVVLDMEHLDFMCSSGLGALLNAHAKARPFQGQLSLANPSAMVLRLLETTRLTNLFTVFTSVDEALEGK